MSVKKSLNHLDYQNVPPITAKEILDEENFFIGTIFDISNEQTNTMNKETNTEWSVALSTNRTNICYKLDSVAQVNVTPENQIETLHAKLRITTSTTTLSTYNGSNRPVNGQFTLDIQHQGNNIFLLFIVADTNFCI